MTDPNLDFVLSETRSGRSTRSDIRGSISDVDTRILELEQALAAARLERQDLQTRLDSYTYPILTLPIEITSEIFVHFLPPYPERPPAIGLSSPHILGEICRTWREIALSTPRLWRAIELHHGDVSWTMALDLLRAWLLRSKNCPLSISLQFTDDLPDLETDVIPFVEAVIPHSERWEYIDFRLPIQGFRLIGSDFPSLHSLTLGPTDYAGKIDSRDSISPFRNAPSLKHATLSDTFGPSEIQLPWAQLTTISACILYAAECAAILEHATTLVAFRCDQVCYNTEVPLPVGPLMCLQSLELGDNNDEGLSGQRVILDALTTPALRQLSISDSYPTESNPIPEVNALILRSRCTLVSLTIAQTREPVATYLAAFPSIPIITVID
ncbi:hypothetical protein C8J57DRAFT_1174528 [Mycena rebaudengoi]|nr:hypothetical protein C8J57DRAFT_1174528 [Mycena rebaudengoi]